LKKVFVILLACLSVFIAGNQPDIVAPYLAKSCHSLNPENTDLSFMGTDLNRQVFLSGAQWHGTTYNYDLHYALITALNRQAGVKYMLLDSGYATAQVYNDYLQTGNPELLKMALNGIRFSNSSSDEHRLFWENLYHYNQGLSPKDKIEVIGIDVEYQISTAISYLYFISDNQLADYYPVTEYLGDTKTLNAYVTGLKAKYQEDPKEFENFFGDNLQHFECILQSLTDTVATDRSRNYFADREKLMYANFLAAYNKDPQGKFFGHFTMEHIYQRQVQTGNLADADRLGMLLVQEDSPVRDQVVSIAAFYHDSEFRFYYGRYENYRVFNSFIVDPLPAIKTAANDYTIYKLEGADSPFTWDTHTVIHPTGGVTTDYYQYLLIIKNSQPTSPNFLPPHQ
jgi:erythromycin esterase-like protein